MALSAVLGSPPPCGAAKCSGIDCPGLCCSGQSESRGAEGGHGKGEVWAESTGERPESWE